MPIKKDDIERNRAEWKFEDGDRVRITGGCFKGAEGTLQGDAGSLGRAVQIHEEDLYEWLTIFSGLEDKPATAFMSGLSIAVPETALIPLPPD